jgi:hypothetical protein
MNPSCEKEQLMKFALIASIAALAIVLPSLAEAQSLDPFAKELMHRRDAICPAQTYQAKRQECLFDFTNAILLVAQIGDEDIIIKLLHLAGGDLAKAEAQRKNLVVKLRQAAKDLDEKYRDVPSVPI